MLNYHVEDNGRGSGADGKNETKNGMTLNEKSPNQVLIRGLEYRRQI